METTNTAEFAATQDYLDVPERPDTVQLPEHQVKDALDQLGVVTPSRITSPTSPGLNQLAESLHAPLVLKAWGPGLLHKSDLGAVRLNLENTHIETAAETMAEQLHQSGITPRGFLVEEQAEKGCELIVGIIHKPSLGYFVAVGLGGIYAELFNDVSIRPWPISHSDALDMLSELQSARLLDGFRGQAAVDRNTLVETLVSIGGEQGIVAYYGKELAEFEINPLIAGAQGTTAVDARVLLYRNPPKQPTVAPQVDFEPVFTPRTAAVVGASARKVNFGNRFLRNYQDYAFPGQLYAIHASAEAIDGIPAYPSLADTPEPIDYALIAVPAPQVAEVLRQGAGRVRFAQVMSGGFRETGSDGANLEQELLAAAKASGIRLLGPNCMGAWSARGRQTFIGSPPEEAGSVSVIAQSGGLAGDILKVGARVGLRFGSVTTIGNSIDVNAAELLEWMIEDPHTTHIGLYIEDPRDGQRLIRALRNCRKPVVMLVSGLSGQGARAAASHTGAMTADRKLWQGIAKQTGAALTSSLEAFMDVLLHVQIQQRPLAATPRGQKPSVLLIGPGGGSNVLGTDAFDSAGLPVTELEPGLRDDLRNQFGLGAGTSVANPVELPVGPASDPALLADVIATIAAQQTFSDLVVHLNVQSFYSYGDNATASENILTTLLDNLAAAQIPDSSRVSVVLRNSVCARAEFLDSLRKHLIEAGVSPFFNFEQAASAIAATTGIGSA